MQSVTKRLDSDSLSSFSEFAPIVAIRLSGDSQYFTNGMWKTKRSLRKLMFDRKAYMKEYQQRPEIKAKRKAYMKEYNASLENKVKVKAYRKTLAGKQMLAKSSKKCNVKNRHKYRAQDKAKYHIKQKELCEVKGCNSVGVMHHEDYDKPLEVNWLCASHHGEFHHRNLTLAEFLGI